MILRQIHLAVLHFHFGRSKQTISKGIFPFQGYSNTSSFFCNLSNHEGSGSPDDISKWSSSDVQMFLSKHGFEKYQASFAEEAVDGAVLKLKKLETGK